MEQIDHEAVELHSMTEFAIFNYAFKLGARMMLGTLIDERQA